MNRVQNSKTLWKLTFSRIKTSRARSVFILLAIIFTTVLVTGVINVGVKLQNADRQMNIQRAGLVSQIYVKTLTPENAQKVLEHPLIKNGGSSLIIATSKDGEWAEYNLETRCEDEVFAANSLKTPMTGRLPETEGEVAVKAWMLDMLGLPRELGVQFPLVFEINGVKHDLKLTVCGFWDDDMNMHPWGTALISKTLADELLIGVDPEKSLQTQNFNGVIDITADVSDSYKSSAIEKNLNQVLYETGLLSPDINSTINPAYDVFSDPTVNIGIVFILAIVIVAGFLLTYNIYYISVLSDINYYGMLKTIGTTDKQIIKMVNMETAFYCLFGIPSGLFVGYFVSSIVTPKVIAVTTLNGADVGGFEPFVYLAAAVLCLITVFVSCRVPAGIAARVSPVEALRFTGQTKKPQKEKLKRYSKNGIHITAFALKNLFRNRKKAVLTFASVLLGLFLFNIVYTFTNSFDINKYVSDYIKGDFLIAESSYINITGSTDNIAGVPETAVEKVRELDGVKSVSRVYSTEMMIESENYPNGIHVQVYGYDEAFYDILKSETTEGIFDPTVFATGEYVVLGADKEGMFAVNEYGIGDEITIDYSGEERTYKILSRVGYSESDELYGLSLKRYTIPGIAVFLPSQEIKSIPGVKMLSVTVYADSQKIDNLNFEIENIIKAYPSLSYRSRNDYITELDSMNEQTKLVGLSLCGIIYFIGILNFINTTLTSIISRKRELSLLWAVGMTHKQERRMLTLECVFFSLICAALFVTIGFFITFHLVNFMTAGSAAYTYQFTLKPLLYCFIPLTIIAILLPNIAYRRAGLENLRV
jgi:putative ABC transport system permease protein